MALDPDEKAALALRLCAARYLDERCGPSEDEDPEGYRLIKAARGVVEGTALGAELSINTDSEIGPWLGAVADKLAALERGSASEVAVAKVDSAEVLLRATARHVRENYSGDGSVFGSDTSLPCSCGILELAALVEMRVRQLLTDEACFGSDCSLIIKYITAITSDSRGFEPFCVGGNTTIRKSPRTIEIILKNTSLTSIDLWHIAYTLHHELVCHAFQGASATRRLPDAHPTCHWSEGWMDTLAFDLVKEWKEAPEYWLPLRGRDAEGVLGKIHQHRYDSPAELTRDADVKLRRAAREAYQCLADTLEVYWIARSAADARKITRLFSLAANTHPEADCKKLKIIGSKLRILLRSGARPAAGVAAAKACLAFTENRNLVQLERALEEMLS